MRILVLLLCMLLVSGVNAIESVRLKGVVTKGYGLIDVTEASQNDKHLSFQALEAYRQDNNGALVFAVDVNEAANGTEKATTQGVAVERAILTVTEQGVDYVFDVFSTQTQSLLHKDGIAQPALYYTLLGDSGSARITSASSSDINGSSFDSTLRMPVDRDLSTADRVMLEIKFLDTQVSLGDPEAFYDYSNGYEDVALLSSVDAVYLDNLQAGVAEAPLVMFVQPDMMAVTANSYYPSSTDYYVVAYEDKYPAQGDYDFNDCVVGYQVRLGLNAEGDVLRAVVRGYLIARGAQYSHDWYFRFASQTALYGRATLSLYEPLGDGVTQMASVTSDYSNAMGTLVFEDTKSLFRSQNSTFVNTLQSQEIVLGPKFQLVIEFNQPVALSQLGDAPYDPYLFVRQTGYEIHQAGQSAVLNGSVNASDDDFVDGAGYPFALVFPNEWSLPLETIDLGLAYPEFVEFTNSHGKMKSTWYLNADNQKVKNVPATFWRW